MVYNEPRTINFQRVLVNITRDTRLLMDWNDTSCIMVSRSLERGSNFRTKFPWPVLNSASQTFTASLIGNRIQTCANRVIFDTLPKGEQQMYTPPEFRCLPVSQTVLDAESERVSCEFKCTCGQDVCSMVYLSVPNHFSDVEFCEVAFNWRELLTN